jgi:hypothetical protein
MYSVEKRKAFSRLFLVVILACALAGIVVAQVGQVGPPSRQITKGPANNGFIPQP